MRFGAHCFVFVERWSDECLPVLDQARALGLDCFEIAVGDDVTFDRRRLRRHAEKLSLELIVSPGAEWPSRCDLTAANAADRQAGLAWHRQQIDLAAELGAAAYTGALYGHPGTVQRRRPPPDELQWAAAGLRELAAHGARRQVAVVIEPMSHFRSHVVNTPEQAMRLLALVADDNLRVLLDTYHMVTEVTDYAAGIATIGDRLWGIHACENNRGVPGSGILPWPAICQALHDVGFDGPVIFESYNSSLGDFACQRGMFHDVCSDAHAFVEQGLRFMQHHFALAAKPGG